MTSSQLQEYARFGAQARLQAIEEERRAIVAAFPDLGRSSGRSNGASSPATSGRRGMSPSQRKAVGERMKAYWAKRRGEKAGRAASDTQSASDSAASSASKSAKRKGMSADARKAQGERMRAYWAARRGEKSAGDGSVSTTRRRRKVGRKT